MKKQIPNKRHRTVPCPIQVKYLKFVLFLIFCIFLCSCGDLANNSSETITKTTNSSINVYPQEYKSVIEDYKSIVKFRISKDFEIRYNNKEFPDISADLKVQIYNKNDEQLQYHWWNMIADMTDYIENPSIDSFGYLLKDINSDSLNELFWVDEKNNILAIFTIQEGKVKLIDSFWPRHSMIINDKNELVVRSSGGADYVDYEIMSLDSNFDLKTVAKFGTNGRDKNNNSILFYENINNKNQSVSEKRFNELLSQYPFEKTGDD